MGDLPDGPPVVPLPERLDRRLRLGPFASARDALRFVTYSAVGAVVAPFTSPYVWLLFVAGGFAACVVRSDGRAFDERGAAFLRWKLRAGFGNGRMTRAAVRRSVGSGLVAVGSSRLVAILRSGGTPVTYLPPAELARRFEQFRDLLRSVKGGLGLLIASSPMASGPVLPRTPSDGRGDGAARAGYVELVTLLCRRRQVRRVYLALAVERTGAEGISDLEQRVASLTERLGALGLRVVRLRDSRLRDAARRWGWT